MAKKICNGLFVGIILLILLAGLGKAVFLPKDVNAYENRYAVKLPAPTLSGWLDGSFQSGVDSALADQVTLAQACKKAYHLTSSNYLRLVSGPVLSRCQDRYVNFAGALMFNGFTTYYTRTLSTMTEDLEGRAAHYNDYFAAWPGLDFYVYFIEKDTDINFQTGEKVGVCEYLFDRLELPGDHLARFRIDSFDQFSQWFYRTDHHWNCDGSYRGYTQLLELLGVKDKPLSPQGDAVLVGEFSGSKATGMASGFSEPLYAYRFAFPDMEITINGAPSVDYGQQEYFLSGQGDRLSYGSFYGWDDGEVTFSTGRPGLENLLVIGESYDNAVLKLLASHFNETCSVDLRYYKTYMGRDFDFAGYVEEHGIDKVLLIGNIDYFILPEFNLGG